uniref:Ig-like domain-containing protein n=2 Tax=root TaxID=1 RepID=A0A674GWI9_TAEGU
MTSPTARPPRPPRPPTVDVFHSCSAPDLVELLCLVTTFSPPPVSVDWLRDGSKMAAGHAHTEPAAPDVVSGTFRTVSRLNVSVEEWRDEVFSCRATHGATGAEVEATVGRFLDLLKPNSTMTNPTQPNFWTFSNPTQLNPTQPNQTQILDLLKPTQPNPTKPKFWTFSNPTQPNPTLPSLGSTSASISIFTIPPSPSDLYITQTPKIRCLVTNLPSNDGLSVTWSRDGADFGKLAQPLPLQLSQNFNGTLTAVSELPVSVGDWESGAAFVCRVGHAELPAPAERRVERRPGKRFPPSVFLLPPPLEELSSSRPTLSLTCLARGFFPDSIDVQWQKNQETLGNSGGIPGNSGNSGLETWPPRREKGGEGRYFLYSRLEVEREEWEKGATFVCTVVHEGLPMRFLQRSVHRNPGN